MHSGHPLCIHRCAGVLNEPIFEERIHQFKAMWLVNVILASAAFVVRTSVIAQAPNDRLRAELEAIRASDQRDRENVHHFLPGSQRDRVITHMMWQDEMNLERVTAIIDSA